MPKLKLKRLPLFTMMSNTVLFGVAAGLLGYCWLKYSYYNVAAIVSDDAWWTLNEKLMLSTFALLLGGFFHSILILYPEYVKKDREITSSNERANELQHQAMSDSLTGLHNRRFFDESLRTYLKEFEQSGLGMGLLLLDLDYFKSINDDHGHDAGDLVLKEIAAKLKQITREHDVVARIGGEEFAVITRCTDRGQLASIASRYRSQIGDITVVYNDVSIRPTVSIGVATNHDSNVPEELLKIADIRLYRAKQNGRNQIAA